MGTATIRDLEAWSEWLSEVKDDLVVVYSDRAKWSWLRRAAAWNKNIPAPWTFLQWLGRLYASSVSVAIRRHVDRRTKVRSLRRLLESIQQRPIELSTYERYRHEVLVQPVEEAAAEFVRWAGSGQRIGSDRIQEDLDRLDQVAGGVSEFVNERLAHLSDTQNAAIPTFDDLEAVLAELESIIQEYGRLLEGAGLLSMTAYESPVLFDAALTVAWVPDDELAARGHSQYPRDEEAHEEPPGSRDPPQPALAGCLTTEDVVLGGMRRGSNSLGAVRCRYHRFRSPSPEARRFGVLTRIGFERRFLMRASCSRGLELEHRNGTSGFTPRLHVRDRKRREVAVLEDSDRA